MNGSFYDWRSDTRLLVDLRRISSRITVDSCWFLEPLYPRSRFNNVGITTDQPVTPGETQPHIASPIPSAAAIFPLQPLGFDKSRRFANSARDNVRSHLISIIARLLSAPRAGSFPCTCDRRQENRNYAAGRGQNVSQMRRTRRVEFPHGPRLALHSHINIEIRCYDGWHEVRAVPLSCIL